jgi:hypothetical protein
MAAQPDGTLYDNENQMTADYLEALLAEGEPTMTEPRHDIAREQWRELLAGPLAGEVLTAEKLGAMWRRGYDQAIADLQNDAPHRYLSWACWHADHDPQPELHGYCQTNAKRYDGTEKVAAECKFCPSKCVCGCHGATEVVDGDGQGVGDKTPDTMGAGWRRRGLGEVDA